MFSRLVIDRKNDGRQGENAGSDDLEEVWSASLLEPTLANVPDQTLRSEEAPGEHINDLVIQAAEIFAPVGFEVLKDEKDVQHYRGSLLLPLDGEPFNGLASTADPHGTGGVAASDVTLVKEPVVPVTLQHLLMLSIF